jgi:hypothetical protein
VECLDANAVQDLMSSALDEVTRAAALDHLDGCDECRALLATLAREAARDSALTQTSDLALDQTLAAETASRDTVTSEPPARSMATRSPSQTGRTLGRYTLVERLGAGAMGVVYKAEDPELGRAVALKLLHAPDPKLTERLVREARSMAQVNHPNVVAVYDVGVADGATYIAMELVPGTTLRAWQHQARHEPNEILLHYAAAGRGLAAAHAAGIVHRDFKPDNCLLGVDGRVRVTDFGLAAVQLGGGLAAVRAAGADDALPSDLELTAAGSVLGTPAYMAPEQFTGGNVDARTDQFNFCVALYEALYGERPFAGKTFDELGAAVCDGRVRAAPAGAHVSRALRAIVLRGLSIKPGDRFPTMDDLLRDLGRDRARPWRRTAIVGAAVAAVLAIGLGADAVVRNRVEAQIHQSFAATGRQTDRAWTDLTGRFDAAANQVYYQPIMRTVSSAHDQADFGLGSADDDRANLEHIKSELASADWTLTRELAGRRYQATVAILDYKMRLLYSSAAPASPIAELGEVPQIKRAIDAGDRSIALWHPDDPALAKSGIFGPTPSHTLGLVYTRTVLLAGVAASALVEEVDAAELFEDIALDETQLSLVAPDGTAIGAVPDALVAVALRGAGIHEATHDGEQYEVQAVPLRGYDEHEVGRIVMARKLTSVLQLFPNARAVLAIATLAMLALALATALRARQITRGTA